MGVHNGVYICDILMNQSHHRLVSHHICIHYVDVGVRAIYVN